MLYASTHNICKTVTKSPNYRVLAILCVRKYSTCHHVHYAGGYMDQSRVGRGSAREG